MKKVLSILFVVVIAFFGIMTIIQNWSDLHLLSCFDKGIRKEAFASIEDQIQTDFYKRYGWISLNGAFLKAAGIDFLEEASGTEVYRMKNGYPTFNCPYVANLPEKAKAVKDLYDHLKEKKDTTDHLKNAGGPELIYVMLPYKVPAKEAMPEGGQDFARENAQQFLSLLKEYQVPYLDLYSQYLQEVEDYGELFFHTDHHWTIQTALDAANRICRELQERWNLPYDPAILSPDAYEITTYPNSFLGSLGKRTGIYYAGIDDFDLYLPRGETNFSFTADSANGFLEREGSFADTLLVLSRLFQGELFRTNTYMTYIGGDYRINHVVNHRADNDTSVLLLRDSFSCALEPFLCMNYGEVTAIDLRYYGDMSLYEYLDTHEIDVVMIALMPEMLDYDVEFQYDGERQN